MGMKAEDALACANKYTDDSLAGAGAVAGKPCQIQSITDITGGHRVTFLWLDNEGTEHTSTMDVTDGVDGRDGVDGTDGTDGTDGADGFSPVVTVEEITGGHRVTITDVEGDHVFDVLDGTGSGGAVVSVNGKTGAVTLGASDVGALPDDTPLFSGDYDDLTDKPDLSGFITKSVNDLVNYYTKSETYTQAEVDALIAALVSIDMQVVSSLPTTDISTTTIYLVPSSDPQTQNVKDEYINLDGTTAGWEKIGSTDIDLTGYVTTSDLNTALAAYTTTTDLTTLLAGKQDALTAGHGIEIANNVITAKIKAGANVSVTYDSSDNSFSISSTGGGIMPKIVINSDTGSTVTVACPDGTTASATAVSGHWEYTPLEFGTYTIHSVLSGMGDETRTVVVDTIKSYSVDAYHNIAFAFHYSENDSDPDSVTYPEGYDNYGWTPFQMNLTTGAPDYGSWDPDGENADKLRWFYPKSCMLKYDGTVDYYLDEDDETKKADGTASDVASAAYGGNAMMEWAQDGKKIYWKVVPDQDGKGFTFVVANHKADNDMQAWNHYDANGDLADHFYTAKYFGSNDTNNKLRSISGGTNMVSQTRNTEVERARANNATSDIIWDTEVYSDWFLIGMLCCLMGRSMNTQAKFGKGNCSTSAAIGQGTMNGKGQFFGKSDGSSGVKVFGMENFWGNIWRAIRGLVTDGSTKAKIKLTHGTQDGTSASDYNFDGTGYIEKSAITGTSGSYTSAMDISVKGLTPKTVSGTETTYYTDGCWFAANCYALVGGDWDRAGRDGALCVRLNAAASHTHTAVGAALSCKPLAAS